MGYPKPKEEALILKKTLEEGGFLVQPVVTLEEIIAAKLAVRRVFVHEALINYIVEVVGATRKHPSIVLGVSPRGSQLLMRAAQASAFLDGRDFVKPDDIKGIAPYVFGHRILPKVKANRINHAEIIEKVLETIAIPG
jgi:MoxR-like ATPase